MILVFPSDEIDLRIVGLALPVMRSIVPSSSPGPERCKIALGDLALLILAVAEWFACSSRYNQAYFLDAYAIPGTYR